MDNDLACLGMTGLTRLDAGMQLGTGLEQLAVQLAGLQHVTFVWPLVWSALWHRDSPQQLPSCSLMPPAGIWG